MFLHRIGAFSFVLLLLTVCGDVRLVSSYPISATDLTVGSNDIVSNSSAAANQTSFNLTSSDPSSTSNIGGNLTVLTPTNAFLASNSSDHPSFNNTLTASLTNTSIALGQANVTSSPVNQTFAPLNDTLTTNNTLDATQTPLTTPLNVSSVNATASALNSTDSVVSLNGTSLPNFNVTSLTNSASIEDRSSSAMNNATDAPPTYKNAEDGHLEQDSSVEPFLGQFDMIASSDSQRAYGPAPYEVRYHALGDEDNNFDVPKHWGPYAPYFSNPSFASLQNFHGVPEGCTIKQVNLLHRHGARLPASKNSFVQWFESGTSERASIDHGRKITFSGPLHFLNDWSYRLGRNGLTAAGTQQMFDSGIQAHYRYGGLFNVSNVAHRPVVRSLTQQRVAESAKWWSRGYYGDRLTPSFDLQMQPGMDGYNSTLASNQTCPAADMFKRGDELMLQWVNRYTKRAVKRLDRYVHAGNLTPLAVFGMQALCAHETFALGQSDFCSLFSEEEWQGFEYAFDLDFQANYGFMSRAGLAQGIGWVQELVARLTNTPIVDHFTSQNTTLDVNATSFPLDQAFYADFTHGRQIVSVLTAMNFTALADMLDPKQITASRKFVASHVIPSAARLYVELLECNEERNPDSGDAHKHYVRTFLNDALLPMSADQGCLGHNAVRDGLCPLSGFVNHVNKVSVPKADYEHTCFPEVSSNKAI